MGYEVRTTAEFDACLNEAISFRIDNYGLRSARRLLDATDRAGELLAQTPFIGTVVDDSSVGASSDELRWIRIDTYIAIYRVEDERSSVYLLKLLHGTTNWRRRVRRG